MAVSIFLCYSYFYADLGLRHTTLCACIDYCISFTMPSV